MCILQKRKENIMILNCDMLSDDFKEGILTLEKYGFVTTGKQGIVIKADFGKQVMVQKSE